MKIQVKIKRKGEEEILLDTVEDFVVLNSLESKEKFITSIFDKNTFLIKQNEIVDYHTDTMDFLEKTFDIEASELENMNLYLFIGQQSHLRYDYYDSIVICAYTEAEALKMAQNKDRSLSDCKLDKVIGIASSGMKEGEVISSFNAG